MHADKSRRDAWRSVRAKEILEAARAELRSIGFACSVQAEQPEPEAELGIVLRCTASADSLNLALDHATVGSAYTKSSAGLELVRREQAAKVVGEVITVREFALLSEDQQLAYLAHEHVLPRRSTERIYLDELTGNYQSRRLVLSGDQLLPGDDEVDDGTQERRLWLGIESKDQRGSWLHEAEFCLYEAQVLRLMASLQHVRGWLSGGRIPDATDAESTAL